MDPLLKKFSGFGISHDENCSSNMNINSVVGVDDTNSLAAEKRWLNEVKNLDVQNNFRQVPSVPESPSTSALALPSTTTTFASIATPTLSSLGTNLSLAPATTSAFYNIGTIGNETNGGEKDDYDVEPPSGRLHLPRKAISLHRLQSRTISRPMKLTRSESLTRIIKPEIIKKTCEEQKVVRFHPTKLQTIYEDEELTELRKIQPLAALCSATKPKSIIKQRRAKIKRMFGNRGKDRHCNVSQDDLLQCLQKTETGSDKLKSFDSEIFKINGNDTAVTSELAPIDNSMEFEEDVNMNIDNSDAFAANKTALNE